LNGGNATWGAPITLEGWGQEAAVNYRSWGQKEPRGRIEPCLAREGRNLKIFRTLEEGEEKTQAVTYP